jgi:alkaline phosphatase
MQKLSAAKGATKLLGLFNPSNLGGALDRYFLKKGSVAKFPDQPDLTDQVSASLDILSRNEKGFVLMVESGRTGIKLVPRLAHHPPDKIEGQTTLTGR